METIPYGCCHCGCGEKTNIATMTSKRKGHVKGEPVKFILGHQKRTVVGRVSPPNPSGLCICGCGGITPIATNSLSRLSRVAGEHCLYIPGHHLRKSPVDYVIEDRGYKSPCWIWQGSIDIGGYGSTRNGPAHRVFYERYRGRLKSGFEPDHLCRQRACVNPEHLEEVTHTVNVRRSIKTVLNMELAQAIREMRANGALLREVAAAHGVSISTVADVCARRTWN